MGCAARLLQTDGYQGCGFVSAEAVVRSLNHRHDEHLVQVQVSDSDRVSSTLSQTDLMGVLLVVL